MARGRRGCAGCGRSPRDGLQRSANTFRQTSTPFHEYGSVQNTPAMAIEPKRFGSLNPFNPSVNRMLSANMPNTSASHNLQQQEQHLGNVEQVNRKKRRLDSSYHGVNMAGIAQHQYLTYGMEMWTTHNDPPCHFEQDNFEQDEYGDDYYDNEY